MRRRIDTIGAEIGASILCGSSLSLRTAFILYVLRRARKLKNDVFLAFPKNSFFHHIMHKQSNNNYAHSVPYLQHFHETDDFGSEQGRRSVYINVQLKMSILMFCTQIISTAQKHDQVVPLFTTLSPRARN